MATEAILTRDGVALLDERVVGVGTEWLNGGVDLLLGLEVEADDAPGDLGFVGVGEDFEGGGEAGVGDEEGTHGVAARERGPLGGGFAVEAHDEEGVVVVEVGGRVVGGVGVGTEGGDHVGAGGCAEESGEFFEGEAGDAYGLAEAGVVGDGVGFEGEMGEVGEGDEACLAAWDAGEGAAEFEVGGALAGAVERDAGGLREGGRREAEGG